jgi:hypothetical protein
MHSAESGADVGIGSVDTVSSVAVSSEYWYASGCDVFSDVHAARNSITSVKRPTKPALRIASPLCINSQFILSESAMRGSDEGNMMLLDFLMVKHNGNY